MNRLIKSRLSFGGTILGKVEDNPMKEIRTLSPSGALDKAIDECFLGYGC
jgi:hypothetical protein